MNLKKKIYSTTGSRQCSAGLITTDIQTSVNNISTNNVSRKLGVGFHG